MYEAEPEQLFLRPAAGVVFHRQSDELKQRHDGKNHDDDGKNDFQHAKNDADKENGHVSRTRELRYRHQRHSHVEQSVSGLMLERVTGFVRGNAHGGDRPAMKIVRRQKQGALGRVVMVAQFAGYFLHRHAVKAGAVKNFARGFRARHAGLHRHLAVFAIGVAQFDLCPDADEQSGNREQQIQWIEQIKHKSTN